ncbi:MAG TPA: GntR family transcriptional regulator [Anaeromyxobacteraceae bacterium]|nr:GntR family transcriptional regulator [Anaeromyxobacteraceae bacterium]
MKIVKGSLHNEAVTRIRDMITEGHLEPGSKISEKHLCELFGISRTPLREALKVLATEGLLELLPNRGARVARHTRKDLGDLFHVMAALEGLAGELACQNVTADALDEIRALHHEMLAHYARRDRAAYFRTNQAIHEAIIAAADNRVLSMLYETLRGRIRPARYMANLSRERWEEAVNEHGEILEALSRRDGARLRELLRLHLEHKYESLLAAAAAEEKGPSHGKHRPDGARQKLG